MDTIENIYSMIKSLSISSHNQVYHKGLSLSINFIELPEKLPDKENVILATFTVMKDKRKQNALEPQKFARVMGIIESGFETASNSLDNVYSPLFYESIVGVITPNWYKRLKCHRVFLIYTEDLFIVMENLFKRASISELNQLGIEEVSVIISTDAYDGTAQFY